MDLTRFPRVRLTQSPTPIEFLPRITEYLGGPEIYIKRDDNTGLATGGNKTRKLEFLIGDALAKGATHVVTQGATQSNHVRQTIAAAARHGLKATALLEQRVGDAHDDYYANGNLLLDRILGASLETRAAGSDMNAELEAVGERLRAAGEKPYLIPGGGSNPIGALGYVVAAQEILWHANEHGLHFDQVIHATGSTGTQAGLVAGLQGLNSGIPVLGISVRAARAKQEENVLRLARQTWDLLGLPGELGAETVQANSDYVGPGYGIPTPGMIEAVELLARFEGILLDPVYSGKGFAGLIDLVRKGHYRKGQKLLFVHTGGAAGLFAYRTVFTPENESWRHPH
ncbi:MAG: D-cysteine desulfhydrase [Candidatus Dactylopiibacterium carminicum]|uniref:L-cysteate sulfo-lyase n=1 Tax=Candidatus Dactylopiibacterium carminicum TaxID=857335 RepID=A0A272EN79_9RHOO|nr:D-cysteine desulfhydrase [Candidatus Dactylopiibacterium carminicum]KAF7598025.1 D-cysteine desulfhydrase [Candidatus Dactylopiibacterium carminicum]PAS91575.1 MAG: D-cysteine desulfhydrase [Candidatus Dactylopiibacterium carminicum]PAS96338.1 MAG: D-cysteine desulfhydrase [Candidatus Dactylopiibacterium carminicum]